MTKHGKYGSKRNGREEAQPTEENVSTEENVTQDDLVQEEQTASEEQVTEDVTQTDVEEINSQEVENMPEEAEYQDVDEELTEEDLDLSDEDLSEMEETEDTEAAEQEESVEEKKPLSIGEVIAQQLELAHKKRENALKEAEDAKKKAEMIEKLQAAASDEALASIIDKIGEYDKQLAELTSVAHAESKPLQDRIDEINAKLVEEVKPINENRNALYNQLVDKAGEIGAKMLVSQSGLNKLTVKRAPSLTGSKGDVRGKVLEAVCDRGLSPAEAAESIPLYGNNEKAVGGTQANGTLVQRHLKIAKEKGLCTVDSTGKWVRSSI